MEKCGETMVDMSCITHLCRPKNIESFSLKIISRCWYTKRRIPIVVKRPFGWRKVHDFIHLNLVRKFKNCMIKYQAINKAKKIIQNEFKLCSTIHQTQKNLIPLSQNLVNPI